MGNSNQKLESELVEILPNVPFLIAVFSILQRFLSLQVLLFLTGFLKTIHSFANAAIINLPLVTV
jgi:hypothetical protein